MGFGRYKEQGESLQAHLPYSSVHAYSETALPAYRICCLDGIDRTILYSCMWKSVARSFLGIYVLVVFLRVSVIL